MILPYPRYLSCMQHCCHWVFVYRSEAGSSYLHTLRPRNQSPPTGLHWQVIRSPSPLEHARPPARVRPGGFSNGRAVSQCLTARSQLSRAKCLRLQRPHRPEAALSACCRPAKIVAARRRGVRGRSPGAPTARAYARRASTPVSTRMMASTRMRPPRPRGQRPSKIGWPSWRRSWTVCSRDRG